MHENNKLHCTKCHSYQEGYKWVEISSFPPVLIFHLNRFAFSPDLEQGHKLKHRVAFKNCFSPPAESFSPSAGPVEYELFAVVVHVGTALAHGVPLRKLLSAEASAEASVRRDVPECHLKGMCSPLPSHCSLPKYQSV
jgi:hypothetical protein